MLTLSKTLHGLLYVFRKCFTILGSEVVSQNLKLKKIETATISCLSGLNVYMISYLSSCLNNLLWCFYFCRKWPKCIEFVLYFIWKYTLLHSTPASKYHPWPETLRRTWKIIAGQCKWILSCYWILLIAFIIHGVLKDKNNYLTVDYCGQKICIIGQQKNMREQG